MRDPFLLAAWWYQIEWFVRFWDEDGGPVESRSIARDKAAIKKKLREVVPRPTKVGIAQFTAYRQQKEKEDRVLPARVQIFR